METQEITVLLNLNEDNDNTKVPDNNPPIGIETAIKCNLDEFYFKIPLLLSCLFSKQNLDQYLTNEEYFKYWNSITMTRDMCIALGNLHVNYQNVQNVSFH